jgi:hypothetical protein
MVILENVIEICHRTKTCKNSAMPITILEMSGTKLKSKEEDKI